MPTERAKRFASPRQEIKPCAIVRYQLGGNASSLIVVLKIWFPA